MERQRLKKIAKVSAPGKIILCGQHAVVYGQDALAMAIDLRCTATISGLKDKNFLQSDLWIQFADSKSHKIDLKQRVKENECFAEFFGHHKQCGQQFAKLQFKTMTFLNKTDRNLPQNTIFSIYVHSDVPMGKCLGSSASFNTVLAASLYLITGDTQEHIMLNLEKINNMSKIFEGVEHGTPSGIDNYVSTFGGMVLFNNSKTPSFIKIRQQMIMKRLTEELQIFLVDSGVEKNTKKAVGIVRERYQSDNKYREMVQIIGTYGNKVLNLLSSEQSRLNEKSWKQQLLQILAMNHYYLSELGVSIEQIDEIVEKLNIKGKRTAKVTGAGMGGYVLVIADPSSPPILSQQYHVLNTKPDPNGLSIHLL